MEDLLYTVSEASEVMKVSKNYVYRLIRSGLLPCLRLGRLKIRRNAVESFLERYEGMDLSDPENVKILELKGMDDDV